MLVFKVEDRIGFVCVCLCVICTNNHMPANTSELCNRTHQWSAFIKSCFLVSAVWSWIRDHAGRALAWSGTGYGQANWAAATCHGADLRSIYIGPTSVCVCVCINMLPPLSSVGYFSRHRMHGIPFGTVLSPPWKRQPDSLFLSVSLQPQLWASLLWQRASWSKQGEGCDRSKTPKNRERRKFEWGVCLKATLQGHIVFFHRNEK